MGAALIIMILVGAGESADVSTRAVRSALEAAARRPVTVSVRETTKVPDEAEAAWLAADAKVDVVVEVGWVAPAHDHAVVHLHGRDGRMLRASELDFSVSEPRIERGRAIGFAVATMLADEPVAAGIVASTAAAESPAPAADPPPAPHSSSAAPPVGTTTTAAPVAPVDHVARGPSRAEAHPTVAIEAAGTASADARGAATGLGPVLRLQWNVSRDVGLRVGGLARWFTGGTTSATELGAATGVLWTFASGALFAASLRAEVGLVHDALTEQVAATNPKGMALPRRLVDRASWAPTLLAGIEGAFRPARATALFVALNAEASTRTVVGQLGAQTSAIWGSLEGGVRISF